MKSKNTNFLCIIFFVTLRPNVKILKTAIKLLIIKYSRQQHFQFTV